jgi:hypothetical protein
MDMRYGLIAAFDKSASGSAVSLSIPASVFKLETGKPFKTPSHFQNVLVTFGIWRMPGRALED